VTGGRVDPVVERRVPRWSDFSELIQPRRLAGDATDRRLARAATIGDLRDLARRSVPRAVFDYTDGAAGAEISLQRSREAYRRVEFCPRVLRDVSAVDPATTLLGAPSALPLVFAPTGFTRLMHTEGEAAVGRVAERVGVPYALSTMGTTSIEALAAAAPGARRWFQLYLWRDREASAALVQRAAAAGYEALVLTVDTPVAGPRLRDVRNGFSIPPALTVRTVANAAVHPRWWIDLLTTPPLEFASLRSWGGTVAELVDRVFEPAATLADVGRLRASWPGALVVKGVQGVDDARAVVDAGADAVVVSNHGGRQLDRSPTPLEQLPAVARAVGDRAEVHVDGGILDGADVVAAVALGARACLVGRAYLYGLMAGGERGVQRAADILSAEISRTMQLLGVADVAELTAERARLRP
jgi:L-lactate dehydrogenase (cytochrome)